MLLDAEHRKTASAAAAAVASAPASGKTAELPFLNVPEAPSQAEFPKGQNPRPLSSLESEVIDLFVQLCEVLGQPRSLAEIYGLLFISAQPLTMDDLIQRLHLSKGSASQGLKFLRNSGAVRTVYVPGDRRVHYEAVAQLRKLVAGFLRDQIVPHLESGQERLERIAEMAKAMPKGEHDHVAARVTMLQSWANRGKRFLPLIVRMMGD